MSERKKLTITEVAEVQKVGQKQIPKLAFKATDGETDWESTYFIFRPTLFDSIKQGAIIDAEVDIKQLGDWTNRKVTQIYQDGQPVGGQKQKYYGKSPEEIQAIKAQVAVKAITEMFVADKLDAFTQSENYLAIGLREWLKTALVQDNPLAEVKAPAPRTVDRPGGIPSETVRGETTSGVVDLKTLKFKNAGEFYTACTRQLRLTKSQVDAEIPEYDVTKATQREKAWAQILAVYRPDGLSKDSNSSD